jgi:hypothetical protein
MLLEVGADARRLNGKVKRVALVHRVGGLFSTL